jgi:hypothetical protein
MEEGLFYKMMLNNINGKMYNVIINMYDSIKSCISYNNCISEYFDSLHTLSKAFSKSIKAQNNFLFLSFNIWKKRKENENVIYSWIILAKSELVMSNDQIILPGYTGR